MSSDNINDQTGTAGEAAGETITNLIPDEGLTAAVAVPAPAPAPVAVAGDADADVDADVDYERVVELRIKTVHRNCGGIIPDGDATEVDETVLCDDEDPSFCMVYLSILTYNDLDYYIFDFLGNCGDHGAAEGQRWLSTFEYVYDEEGRETENLEYVTDDELRRIIGAGSGYINVVWYS